MPNTPHAHSAFQRQNFRRTRPAENFTIYHASTRISQVSEMKRRQHSAVKAIRHKLFLWLASSKYNNTLLHDYHQ